MTLNSEEALSIARVGADGKELEALYARLPELQAVYRYPVLLALAANRAATEKLLVRLYKYDRSKNLQNETVMNTGASPKFLLWVLNRYSDSSLYDMVARNPAIDAKLAWVLCERAKTPDDVRTVLSNERVPFRAILAHYPRLQGLHSAAVWAALERQEEELRAWANTQVPGSGSLPFTWMVSLLLPQEGKV